METANVEMFHHEREVQEKCDDTNLMTVEHDHGLQYARKSCCDYEQPEACKLRGICGIAGVWKEQALALILRVPPRCGEVR